MSENDTGPSGGIQSLDAALRLLGALARAGGPTALSELARDCDMPPSKAHRYLTSFVAAGLVAQAGRSGKYDLGKEAAVLGLSALARYDFVTLASEGIVDLSAGTGLTALLSVWGAQGATVVRWQRAESPIITSMGLGTILPLLSSATGRAFLAWGAPAPLRAVRDAELNRLARTPDLVPDLTPTPAGVEELIRTLRTQGYTSVDSRYIPGLVAVAAPVLDWQGEAQAVVTLIGTDPTAIQPGSHAVSSLTAFCQSLSFAPLQASGQAA